MKFNHAAPCRPRLNAVRAGALLTLALLLIPAFGAVRVKRASAGAAFKPTTVFLVRHAEKDTTPPDDPPLNELGRKRSQVLALTLKEAGVKAIYTSQFLRTRQTAAPVATLLGLTPASIPVRMDVRDPRRVSDQSIREIVDKIHAHAGEAALVVGHSNTVPEVIRMLGGNIVPVIDERQFDDLFVVTVYEKGKAKVARLKYGLND